MTRTLAAMGAEVILQPTMTTTIDRELELCILRACSAMNQCYLWGINGVGSGMMDLEQESLERRLEEPLLETLIGHAVFPRYAFPTDVVTFWVSKPRQPGDAPGKRSFDGRRSIRRLGSGLSMGSSESGDAVLGKGRDEHRLNIVTHERRSAKKSLEPP